MGRLWRIIGTVLCFTLYGAMAWLASITILPLLCVMPGTAEVRQQRVRRLASASFRWLLATIELLRLGSVSIEGREWFDGAQGKLVLATHPMYLDIVVLIGLLPLADCVVKDAMRRHPVYGRFIRATGYVSNAEGSTAVQECVRSLASGRTVILFPEGTRSPPGQPLRFRRGAAQVAVRSGCDVVLVRMACDPPALGKHRRWNQVPGSPWRLSIKAFPPRAPVTLGAAHGLPHGVAARRVTLAMENFFNHELEAHEHTGARVETADRRLA